MIEAGQRGADAHDAGHPAVDAGHDAASPEAGACPAGSAAVYGCGGTFFYCCPDDGGNCEAPSCETLDAGHEAAAGEAGGCSSDASCPRSPPSDGGACQAGEYLLIPCCGGVDDSACSNSNGPPAPAPFCTALPASCAGQTTCTVGQCEGAVDQATRTLGCNCI
jgi:hypothetical protein